MLGARPLESTIRPASEVTVTVVPVSVEPSSTSPIASTWIVGAVTGSKIDTGPEVDSIRTWVVADRVFVPLGSTSVTPWMPSRITSLPEKVALLVKVPAALNSRVPVAVTLPCTVMSPSANPATLALVNVPKRSMLPAAFIERAPPAFMVS